MKPTETIEEYLKIAKDEDILFVLAMSAAEAGQRKLYNKVFFDTDDKQQEFQLQMRNFVAKIYNYLVSRVPEENQPELISGNRPEPILELKDKLEEKPKDK